MGLVDGIGVGLASRVVQSDVALLALKRYSTLQYLLIEGL